MPEGKNLLTPKYLTPEIARRAIAVAVKAVMQGEDIPVKRNHCHVVVLVPGMQDDRATDYPNWPDYPTTAVMLAEESFGDQEAWEHPYDNIARCKALQLYTDRNDGRAGIIPHLVFSGDTPYWGGVKRDGIVVACSGVQPWFDRLIAGIVTDTIIALAHHAYETDEGRSGVDFLA